jgi:multicomponent Na+:H+ antiporter subunit C
MIESSQVLYLLTGAALFALGFRGVFADAPPLRRIIAFNVMGSGVFLVFITLAARVEEGRPDPVPHAMVLTGIVVAVCANGVALVLADRARAARRRSGQEDRA